MKMNQALATSPGALAARSFAHDRHHRQRAFFVRKNGLLYATPLMLVLILVN